MTASCMKTGLSMRQRFLTAASLFLWSLPAAHAPAASQIISIDETMPPSIPHEIVAAWEVQDSVATKGYEAASLNIINRLPEKYKEKIINDGTEAAYRTACHWRRVARMQPYAKELKKIVFAKHYDLGGPTPGYLEDIDPDGFVSNMGRWGNAPAQSRGTKYKPGSALCMLEMDDCYPQATVILEDPAGVMKDPCLSYDGKKLFFAWSKDNNGYHIYELTFQLNTGVITPKRKHHLEKRSTAAPVAIRQLTDDPEGLTISDFEPCVTPTCDIIFNSSRCFGYTGVHNNITSNLYVMDSNGKYLRRISYDQGSTFYPTMREDGEVMYSRWEFNDRTTGNCFGIFTMVPDGCRQNEFYGNQTSWPATFNQSRPIPGNPMKALAIIGGPASYYAGDIVIVDASKVRNGPAGVQLIAPVRSNPSGETLSTENIKPLFQNPFPLDEEWFLVSWRPEENAQFSIFLMNRSGSREMLAWDSQISASQPVSCGERPLPTMPSLIVDYRKKTAVMSVVDVNYGLRGITKGIIKKIRVVALELRTDPSFGSTGTTENTLTPVARWTGTQVAKRIIGETPVDTFGSAAFEVPPRTPFCLQLIDANGCMVQTSRSWITLQPGARYDCSGCHEDKNAAPLSKSMKSVVPVPLKPFFDLAATGYFYYPEQIQPILDNHCVKNGCHDASHSKGLDLRGDSLRTGDLADADNKEACRYWRRSYYNLTDPEKQYVNYIPNNSLATPLRPLSAGSSKSMLITKLRAGHNDVVLSEMESGKLCAWIDLGIPHSGTYTDDMQTTDRENYLVRLERLKKEEAVEAANIEAFIQAGQYRQVQPAPPEPFFNMRNDENNFSTFSSPNSQLTIHTTSGGEITLLDLSGRRMLAKRIVADIQLPARLSLPANLPKGIYIVKFKGAGGISRQRVVSLF